jgi:hypothetical protein
MGTVAYCFGFMLFYVRSLMEYFVVFKPQSIQLCGFFFMTVPPLTSNTEKEVNQHDKWNGKVVQ